MSEETKDETTGAVEAAVEEKPAEEKPADEQSADEKATEPVAEPPASSGSEPAAPPPTSSGGEPPASSGTEPAQPASGSEVLDGKAAWGSGAAAALVGAPPESPAPPPEDERRTAQRKGVRLNKLISANLNEGDALYLHLVDISDGGMRVNGDLEFSQAEPFRLTLQMEAFGKELAEEHPHLTLTCRVVWQKRLLGGMFVSGLQFVDMSSDTETVVKKILERSSPEGRRLRFRLNRVLGVGIGLDEETRWLYPLALDLSVEGMRLRLDEEIEVGSIFPLQIFLEFDLPTVRVQAEAVWREEVGNGRYQVGLRFTEVSEDSAKAIQEYIDRCLAKEGKA